MIPEDSIRGHLPTKIDVVDKKKRGVGLNPRELSDFYGICKFGANQLVDCYGEKLYGDKYLNAYDFAFMCRNCPHCSAMYAMRCKDIGHVPLYDRFRAESCFDGFVIRGCLKEHIDWDAPKCFVYFMDDGEFIKIGKAKSISARKRTLQTSNARNLSVAYVIPCKSEEAAFYVESFLHKTYRRYQMNGEWFDIKEKIDHITFSIFTPEQEA